MATSPDTKKRLRGLLLSSTAVLAAGLIQLAPKEAAAQCTVVTAGQVFSCSGAQTSQTLAPSATPFSITLTNTAAFTGKSGEDLLNINTSAGTENGTVTMVDGATMTDSDTKMTGFLLTDGGSVTFNIDGDITLSGKDSD
ncbi:MAG TPA: hypothetical protein VD713_01355, partial [Sphingomonadales bacterium]|nr:hypothetical protein [Sphingomonadales bacterium]